MEVLSFFLTIVLQIDTQNAHTCIYLDLLEEITLKDGLITFKFLVVYIKLLVVYIVCSTRSVLEAWKNQLAPFFDTLVAPWAVLVRTLRAATIRETGLCGKKNSELGVDTFQNCDTSTNQGFHFLIHKNLMISALNHRGTSGKRDKQWLELEIHVKAMIIQGPGKGKTQQHATCFLIYLQRFFQCLLT